MSHKMNLIPIVLMVCGLQLATLNSTGDEKVKEHYYRQTFNKSLSSAQIDEIKRAWSSLIEQSVSKNIPVDDALPETENSRRKEDEVERFDVSFPSPSQSQVFSVDGFAKSLRSVFRASRKYKEIKGLDQKLSLLAAGIPDVLTAFMVETRRDWDVSRRTTLFVKKYQADRTGTFIRGDGLDMKTGRFHPPFNAIYRFEANVNVLRSVKSATSRPNSSIVLMICIEQQCDENLSLRHRVGVTFNSKIITISVSGHLFLKRGQFVEVVIKNASRNKITVKKGSTFSGSLVGA